MVLGVHLSGKQPENKTQTFYIDCVCVEFIPVADLKTFNVHWNATGNQK